MVAVLGGMGAAVLWAIGTLCATSSARVIGASSVLAWVMLTGLLIVTPWLAYEGVPADLDRVEVGWLAVAGLGNILGLLLAYSALRTGKVGIVAALVSTEGAIAAVIAVIAGEKIMEGVGVTLGLIAVGAFLASLEPTPRATDDARSSTWLVPALAIIAATFFGLSLFAVGRVSTELPIVWTLMPARLVGLLGVALPLAIMSRLRLTRRVAPLLVIAGIAEVLGVALFAIGARESIAVSAVLASQVAPLAAVGAYLVFGERLARVQLAGVAAIVIGISALTVVQT